LDQLLRDVLVSNATLFHKQLNGAVKKQIMLLTKAGSDTYTKFGSAEDRALIVRRVREGIAFFNKNRGAIGVRPNSTPLDFARIFK